MKRRSFLTLLGISPVAAPAAIHNLGTTSGETVVTALNTRAEGQVFEYSTLDSYKILKRAHAAGLISDEVLAELFYVDDYNSNPRHKFEAEINAYKSFSAVTKERMLRRRVGVYMMKKRFNPDDSYMHAIVKKFQLLLPQED